MSSTGFAGTPKMLRGGLVRIDPNTHSLLDVVVFQYNPDTLTRTLQPRAIGGEPGDRLEVLRLTGPPHETIKFDAEIDATDQLEFPDQNPTTAQAGIFPQLAALETVIYPTSSQLQSNNNLAQSGTLEIVPMQAPLTLFVWSQNRILPVRITDFSVTEEAFDPALNPTRAKVSLGMRVLSIDDLGFDQKGGNLFMAYLRQKEQFVRMVPGGALSALGIGGIP